MVLSLDASKSSAGTSFHLKRSVPLANYTSYRVGGAAEWFSLPQTPDELSRALQWAAHHSLPITVLGAGSNLLISDRGLPGLTICTRRLRGSQFDEAGGQLIVLAGEPLPNLAWKAARQGWRGLEWAVGIPGTVGGAIFMNAGAHGSCLANTLVEAQGVSLLGEFVRFQPADLDFAYRTSRLQSELHLITQATLKLTPGFPPQAVVAETQYALDRRRSTQPYHLPSCGSVFRNPEPQKAGALIEQLGLKGFQIGQAQVSTLHANFIVNLGGAKAQDILTVIQTVQQRVQAATGISLHPEVRVLGHFDWDLA